MTRRIDQIKRRIAEIEEKIGMIGVGGDFQTTLEREIAKQAKFATKPTQAVADVQKAANQPINENDVVNSAKVAQALREAEKVETNQNQPSEKKSNAVEPAQKHLPGEEALPGKINQSQRKIERVEVPDTELEIPSREEKVFEDNYSGKDAEVTPVVKGIIEYINQQKQAPAQVDRDEVPNIAEGASVEDLITQAAYEYGVDPQLVKAIAIAESDMNQDEISPVGAIGVMQLMPETAAGLGVDPYDTNENIAGGTKYLKQMLDTFDGDVPLAVAAYNAGPGAVKRYGGIPPYSETKNYVGRVMDMYK